MAAFSVCGFVLAGRQAILSFVRHQQSLLATSGCRLSTSAVRLQNAAQEEGNEEEEVTKQTQRPVVDPDTSIRYLESSAYKESYGDKPVWFYYRRNFKGQIPPQTRKTCIRKGEISTGSPCPICRDEYLVIDFKNVKLLEQFISPHTGEVLDSKKTGVCQKQHKKLMVEVMMAQDQGMLEKVVPFREYDYSQYYDKKTGKVLT